MADTAPPRDSPSLITQFRTSDHWAVSLARDLLWVVAVVGSIALALYLICGTWPAVVTIESGSMIPNMNIGDLVVVVQKDRFGEFQTWDDGKVSGYKKYGDYGDVIIYRPNGYTDTWAQVGLLPFSGQRPIIHRAITWTEAGEPVPLYAAGYVMNTSTTTTHGGYITKGDNNNYSDQPGLSSPVKMEWVVGKAFFAIPYVGYLPLYIGPVIVIVLILMGLHELYLRRKEEQEAEKPAKKGSKKKR